MYQTGDLIVYGSTGVCRVESITTPQETPSLRGFENSDSYYILKPLYQTETIYTPADHPKVFTRMVISRAKAQALIDLIPSMQAQADYSPKIQELKEHYEAAANTHDCADLMELLLSIYAKKQYMEQTNRKFGQIDDSYMKWAEAMLYGEFAVALEMPKEDVPAYIAQCVAAQGEDVGAPAI
ncbi:MAG: CarD family transcriptional regulator [Ruthenibacterium sp.]